MTSEPHDHGEPDEVDAREIREAFGVRVARIRAELHVDVEQAAAERTRRRQRGRMTSWRSTLGA
ncbi:hypothetical protein ACVDFE_10965 [Lentzea chajnantorensis]